MPPLGSLDQGEPSPRGGEASCPNAGAAAMAPQARDLVAACAASSLYPPNIQRAYTLGRPQAGVGVEA